MRIDQKKLREFLKLNRRFWNKEEYSVDKNTKGCICLLHWTEMLQAQIPGCMIAKSIQKSKHLPIEAISFGEDVNLREIDASYGIRMHNFSRRHLPLSTRVWIAIRTILWTKLGNAKKLLKLKHRGIPLGDIFYDIVHRSRIENHRIFEMKQLNFRYDFWTIYYHLVIAERAYQFYQEYKPRYVIARGIQHASGVTALVFFHLGAKLVDDYASYGEYIPVLSYQIKDPHNYKFWDVTYKICKENMINEDFWDCV